jgi:hypothetical protein
MRFSERAEASISGVSFFDVTVEQIERASLAGCSMAQNLPGLYGEAGISELKQLRRRAGRYSAFAAFIRYPSQCYFGFLKLALCPKDGFKVVQVHEFRHGSPTWEILTADGS